MVFTASVSIGCVAIESLPATLAQRLKTHIGRMTAVL
jgi:hypothetical protein